MADPTRIKDEKGEKTEKLGDLALVADNVGAEASNKVDEGARPSLERTRTPAVLVMEPKRGFASLGISKLSLSSAVAQRDQEFGGRASLPRMEPVESDENPTGFYSARGPREFKLSLADNIRAVPGRSPGAQTSDYKPSSGHRPRLPRSESSEAGNPRTKSTSSARGPTRSSTGVNGSKIRPGSSSTRSHVKGERKNMHITPIPTSLGSPRHSPRNVVHTGTSPVSSPKKPQNANHEVTLSSSPHSASNTAKLISSRKHAPIPLITLAAKQNSDPSIASSANNASTEANNAGIETSLGQLTIQPPNNPLFLTPIYPVSASTSNEPKQSNGLKRTPSPVPALLPGGSPRMVPDTVFGELIDSPTTPPLSRRSFVSDDEDSDATFASSREFRSIGFTPTTSREMTSRDDHEDSFSSDSNSDSGSSASDETDSTTSSSSLSNSTDSSSSSGEDTTSSYSSYSSAEAPPLSKRGVSSNKIPIPPSNIDYDMEYSEITDPSSSKRGIRHTTDSDEDSAELSALSSQRKANPEADPKYPYQTYQSQLTSGSKVVRPRPTHITGAPKVSTAQPSNPPSASSSQYKNSATSQQEHYSLSTLEPSPLENSLTPFSNSAGQASFPTADTSRKDEKSAQGSRGSVGEMLSSSDSEGDDDMQEDDTAYDAQNEGSPRCDELSRELSMQGYRANISSLGPNTGSPRKTSFLSRSPPASSSGVAKRPTRSFTSPRSKGSNRNRGSNIQSTSGGGNIGHRPNLPSKRLNLPETYDSSGDSGGSDKDIGGQDKQIWNDSNSMTGSTDTASTSDVDSNVASTSTATTAHRVKMHRRPRASSYDSAASTSYQGLSPTSHSYDEALKLQQVGSPVIEHLDGVVANSDENDVYESEESDEYDEFGFEKPGYRYEEEDEDAIYDDDDLEDDENEYDMEDDEEGEDDFDDEFDALSLSPGSSAMLMMDGGHGEDLYSIIDFESISMEDLILEHNRNPELLYMIEIGDPALLRWLCTLDVSKKLLFALSDQFELLSIEDTADNGRAYEKKVISSFSYYLITSSPNGSLPNFLLENFELFDLLFILASLPSFKASPDWTRVMLFLLSKSSSTYTIVNYMNSELPNIETTLASLAIELPLDSVAMILKYVGDAPISRGKFMFNTLLRQIGNDNVARLLGMMILPEDSTVPWIDIMTSCNLIDLIGDRCDALHQTNPTNFQLAHQSEAANLTEMCGLILSKATSTSLSSHLQEAKFVNKLVQISCKKRPHPLASYCLSIMCYIFDISYNNAEYEIREFAPIIAALLNEKFCAEEEKESDGAAPSSPNTSPSLPLEYWAYQLDNPTLQAISPSQLLNPSRQPFGLYRLHLLKSVNSLLKTNYGLLHREMFRTGLVTSVMNALFRHTTGSLIHLNVAETIGNVMYFERTEWLLDWLVKYDFIEKVAVGFEAAASHLISPASPLRLSASSSSTSLSSTRTANESEAKNDGNVSPSTSPIPEREIVTRTILSGYCEQPEYTPHLVSICIKLERLASSNASLQAYLNNHPRWDSIYSRFVDPLSKQYRELSDVASLRRTAVNSLIAY